MVEEELSLLVHHKERIYDEIVQLLCVSYNVFKALILMICIEAYTDYLGY